MTFIPQILGTIIPTDSYFSEGRYTTNQSMFPGELEAEASKLSRKREAGAVAGGIVDPCLISRW